MKNKILQKLLAAGIFLSCFNSAYAQSQANQQIPFELQDYHPVTQDQELQKTKITFLSLPASELKSVGIELIRPLIQAAPGGMVTVIANGDSMAEQGRSMPYHFVQRLGERLGVVAYVGNYQNNMMQTSTNGTAFDPPNWKWYSGTLPLPPGKEYTFEKESSPGGALADGAGMLWTAHTNGGSFQLLISTNGGPFVNLITLDGYSSNPTGAGRNYLFDQLPIDKYRLKVVGISGTNSLVAPRIGRYHTNGVEVCFFAWGGISIADMTNVSSEVRSGIFSAFAGRTVIILTLVHDDPAYLPHRNGLVYGIPDMERMYSNSLPHYLSANIGATWASTDTNSTQTADQNELIRSNTIVCGSVYWDSMNPFISYEHQVEQGFMLDFVHLSGLGGYTSSGILWNEAGLYALNVPRTPSITPGEGFVTVTHGRSMYALCTIQSSTNLIDWVDLPPSPMGSTPYSVDVPNNGASEYFRLKLSPPPL